MLNYIKDGSDKWTVVIDKPYSFTPEHKRYDSLVKSVVDGDSDRFLELIDIGTSIVKWANEGFTFEDGVLKYNGDEVNRVISDRIIEMKEQGYPYEPMMHFLEKVYENPSFRSVQELYTFMQHEGLPITPNGNFLAYKYVHKLKKKGVECQNGFADIGDFVDNYTKKTFRNNVGDLVSMPRNMVDDNCNQACGAGLHVGSWEYSAKRNYVVICEVNPKNVVSIPVDRRQQKLRCCEYKVVGLFEKKMEAPVMVSVQTPKTPNMFSVRPATTSIGRGIPQDVENDDYPDDEDDYLDDDDWW